MRVRVFGAAVAAAVGLAAAAGPAAADVQLSSDPTAGEVSTAGGAVLWSRYDAATGLAHLVAKVGDAPAADLPVAPFRARRPWNLPDANLGVGLRGTLVAVYPRCDDRGRRCDIWIYDFLYDLEHRVRSVSTRTRSETAPSYDRGVLTYARVDGPRRGLYVRRPGRGPRRVHRHVPRSTAVDARRHALAYEYAPNGYDEVWLRRISFGGRRSRTVARDGAGTDSYGVVARPTFAAGRLHWARAVAGVGSADDGAWLEAVATWGHTRLRTQTVLAPAARMREYADGADAATDGKTIVYAARDGIWRADPPPPLTRVEP